MAKQRKIPIIYFSNLAQLGDELFSVLVDNVDSIKYVSTTIDGTEEKHNSLRKFPDAFNKSINNIDRLLNAGIRVFARTNIGPSNIMNLPELVEFYESKGWFDYPHFRCMISRIVDHHNEKSDCFTEDDAMSQWLKLKDEHPILRKVYNYEVSYVLHTLMQALHLRENVSGINNISVNNLEVDVLPAISHCTAALGIQYTFTGNPCNGIYPCAACSGLTPYKVGSYSPELSINKEDADLWGSSDYITTMRTIDTLDNCKKCAAATFCGGNCLIEAINFQGSAKDKGHCHNIVGVIKNFLDKEEARLYERCKQLLYLWQ